METIVSRINIVEKAREYVNTKFRHQGRIKGVGIDCAGLIVCVGKELGITEYDNREYGRLPNANRMENILKENLIEIQIHEALPGDVLFFAFDAEPQHVGILSENNYVIHSYAAVKKCVEHRIDDVWKDRIRAAYRYPGV